ncbi:MAG: RraA family protein [Rhodospirillales bacterium]
MSNGFRIKKSWERISSDLVDRFRAIPVANVSDCMARMDSGGSNMRPMHRGGVLAGPALTVRSRPGDNLMLHKSIDMAEPGDIIVCDAGGEITNSLFGEMMLAQAIYRKVGGFILNGAVRDRDCFLEHDMPVFAVGVTHRGPYKDGPGEIGFPISLGGMVIRPGDLMLGDCDGVVAVPRIGAEKILKDSQAKHASEIRHLEEIKKGAADRGWVDKILIERGCEFID